MAKLKNGSSVKPGDEIHVPNGGNSYDGIVIAVDEERGVLKVVTIDPPHAIVPAADCLPLEDKPAPEEEPAPAPKTKKKGGK